MDMRLEAVLDSLREGVQVIDREFRYVYLNDAAVRHARKPREELIGKTMMECYPGIEETPMFGVLERCSRDGVSRALDNEFQYPDGTRRSFELRVEPFTEGIVILSIDITDKRRLTEELQRKQKMESLGRVAGSVAHDFNNILSIITTYASIGLEEVPAEHPLHEALGEIQLAAARGAELTRQLLAFSRKQAARPRRVDLSEMIMGLERVLKAMLGPRVTLELACAQSAPVLADPAQLEQVLLNLVINARDAMQSGGTLRVETACALLDEEYTRLRVDVQPGEYVVLRVRDTGTGMTSEVLAHLFEPFFTTKERGHGTGLGLATVFGIVKHAGGHVTVESEPGRGSTFHVYLPRQNHANQAA